MFNADGAELKSGFFSGQDGAFAFPVDDAQVDIALVPDLVLLEFHGFFYMEPGRPATSVFNTSEDLRRC